MKGGDTEVDLLTDIDFTFPNLIILLKIVFQGVPNCDEFDDSHDFLLEHAQFSHNHCGFSDALLMFVSYHCSCKHFI